MPYFFLLNFLIGENLGVKRRYFSAHVFFKLNEKNGNVYYLTCKPTAFGCTLPLTTKDVIFKIYAYASKKKMDTVFSIVDGNVCNETTKLEKIP